MTQAQWLSNFQSLLTRASFLCEWEDFNYVLLPTLLFSRLCPSPHSPCRATSKTKRRTAEDHQLWSRQRRQRGTPADAMRPCASRHALPLTWFGFECCCGMMDLRLGGLPTWESLHVQSCVVFQDWSSQLTNVHLSYDELPVYHIQYSIVPAGQNPRVVSISHQNADFRPRTCRSCFARDKPAPITARGRHHLLQTI